VVENTCNTHTGEVEAEDHEFEATLGYRARSFSNRPPWVTPVILDTQEAEIRRIVCPKPARANSSARPYLEKTLYKKELAEWFKV
jgi:hypothetical protein